MIVDTHVAGFSRTGNQELFELIMKDKFFLYVQGLYKQKTPVQVKPNTDQIKPLPVTNFSCTFNSSTSGIAKPTGDGVFNYDMTLYVHNKGTSTVFSAHGELEVSVNGRNIIMNCSVPPDKLMNQYTVNPGSVTIVKLHCGLERNVTYTSTFAEFSFVRANGKTFGCKLKPQRVLKPIPR